MQAYACAQRCLDLTVEWCRDRADVRPPLISRQPVQNTLAEMARRIEVARVYTRSVAARAADGEPNLVREACFAKNTAVEAGEWVVDQAVQLHGGMGYMRESEVERQYRDMRIIGIGGGTTEILTGLAAKLLGYTGMTRAERRAVDPAVTASTRANRDGAARADSPTSTPSRPRRWPAAATKYVERHHQRGKLLVRERIELLLDPGSPFLELSPLAALGQRLHRRRVGGHRHRRRQRRRVHDQRQRPDGPRRRVQPVDAEEDAAGQRDRAAEPAAGDRAGRVRRRRPADAEGDLHPGRRRSSAT